METQDLTSEDTLELTIDRFWETIPLVWNQIRANIQVIVTDHFDITVEQFHILRHIRKGATSVSELATIKQISRSGVSQAIDLLVEKGLINRKQSQDDRRFVVLALTPLGDAMLNTIFAENRAWMREKLRLLTFAELSSISLGLEALKSTFIDE